MIERSPAALSSVDRRMLLVAVAANFIWINVSEFFRYLLFVLPMMRQSFPQIPGITDMDAATFLIWGVWDAILIVAVTASSWLALARFGATFRNAVAVGTANWLAIFVTLWLGLYNMTLATGAVLAIALPLAWIEMVVAALIMRWSMHRGHDES
jgi:hypothetical protein